MYAAGGTSILVLSGQRVKQKNKNQDYTLQSMKYKSKMNTEENPMEMRTPKAKLSQKTIDLLAEAAESSFDADSTKTLPPNPPNDPPESLSDQIVKVKDGIVCPHDTNGEANGEKNDEPEGQADEEMPPLVDETEV